MNHRTNDSRSPCGPSAPAPDGLIPCRGPVVLTNQLSRSPNSQYQLRPTGTTAWITAKAEKEKEL
ncbi:hypothetical protein ACRALDRAFT_1066032 [Sodiomyces alcalophilus JCM 7366]|uniref:uncharacterized protein n=1 Tax=Sodiomyces alcalophilus JCM 7366 TaxID=591952 RepID=UPI0039B3CA9F